MHRRLLATALAGALATVVSLGATACSNDATLTGSGASTPNATASGTPSTTSSASAPTAGSTANQENPTSTTPASQDPDATFCQTFEAVSERTIQLFDPVLTLESSTDPEEIEQAWQDIQRIAEEGAALSRQAVGLTDDAYLKATAQVFATYFDHVAAAAEARDKAALESTPDPDVPQPPDDFEPPCV